MSGPADSIFRQIQDKKDEHAIMDGVNSFYEFESPDKLRNLPSKTDLSDREIINHNQILYFNNFHKNHYGYDLSESTEKMVQYKELRNIAKGRVGRTEAFDVYAMREIIRNAKQSVGKLLNNALGAG